MVNPWRLFQGNNEIWKSELWHLILRNRLHLVLFFCSLKAKIMARNKRKNIKDREKLKGIRIEARKRWRKKKAKAKDLKEAIERTFEPEVRPKVVIAAKLPVAEPGFAAVSETAKHCAPRKSPVSINVASKSNSKKLRESRTPASVPMKEIHPSEVAKSTTFLGCGLFGTCYLAYYRGIPVAVKEFRLRISRSPDEIKKDVVREAKMIGLLGDHRGLPLLFGVITKSLPLRLITQFHGESDSCTTLHKEIKRKKLDKTSWHGILINVIKALNHMHDAGVIHNDLKSNNVVLEKREKEWNPVVIDFGKARHISNPKPVMDLSIFAQEEYRRSYPHVAPEIISGKGQQSKASDVFSFGKIALRVLNLLPSESTLSLNMAKKLTSEDPAKRPRLNDFADVLDTLA